MRMLTDVLDSVRADLEAEREAHTRTQASLALVKVERDRVKVTLKALRQQIAQHCAAVFWNDVDVGLLHAGWRDALDEAMAALDAPKERE